MMEWQQAVGKAMGAIPCSPTERQRAYQYLHDTGIGYTLGGKIADTLKHLVASGAIKVEADNDNDNRIDRP